MRRQIELTGDRTLLDLVEEVSAYPGSTASPGPVVPFEPEPVAIPLRLATVHGSLAFFGTTTVFGGPIDVTLAELAIEAFFPADPITLTVMRRLAAERAARQDPAPAPRMARRAATG